MLEKNGGRTELGEVNFYFNVHFKSGVIVCKLDLRKRLYSLNSIYWKRKFQIAAAPEENCLNLWVKI